MHWSHKKRNIKWVTHAEIKGFNVRFSLFQALFQCGRLKKWAGDERGLVEKEGAESSTFHSRIPLAADPACHPLTFSIVLTDWEPGTGYVRLKRSGRCRGFIKGQAPGKLTGRERDLTINLDGCFHLLFLLSFIRKTKNTRLKNPTDLLYKNLMKPLQMSCHHVLKKIIVHCHFKEVLKMQILNKEIEFI